MALRWRRFWQIEFLLQFHYEFHGVQGVGTEIVDERGLLREPFRGDAELFGDNRNDTVSNAVRARLFKDIRIVWLHIQKPQKAPASWTCRVAPQRRRINTHVRVAHGAMVRLPFRRP